MNAGIRARTGTEERTNNIRMVMKKQFLVHLTGLRDSHVRRLEGMFGSRDDRFVFGKITRALDHHDVPNTYFPNNFHLNGGCAVGIRISQYPYDHHCYDQGGWQIAHECVHLLDPTPRGGSNFLEEGLATWYQNEPYFHNEQVKIYIGRNTKSLPDYIEAEQLVRNCIPEGLLPAVKEIREHGGRIGKIHSGILAQHLPSADRDVIDRLCESFPL